MNSTWAQARDAALSDKEVAMISGRTHTLPADGDVIGAPEFVFILLQVADIFGFTKVCSFARPIK